MVDEDDTASSLNAIQQRIQASFTKPNLRVTLDSARPSCLAFMVASLERIVGKDNLTYLKPSFYYRTKRYVLNVDVRVPEILLKNSKVLPTTEEDGQNGA